MENINSVSTSKRTIPCLIHTLDSLMWDLGASTRDVLMDGMEAGLDSLYQRARL